MKTDIKGKPSGRKLGFKRSIIDLLDLCLINDNSAWEELLDTTRDYVQSVFVSCAGRAYLDRFTIAFPGWLYVTGRLAPLRKELKRKQDCGELTSEPESRSFFKHYFARIIVTGGIADFFSYSSPSTRAELEKKARDWAERNLENIRSELERSDEPDSLADASMKPSHEPEGSEERKFGDPQTIKPKPPYVPNDEERDDRLLYEPPSIQDKLYPSLEAEEPDEMEPIEGSITSDENTSDSQFVREYMKLLGKLSRRQRIVHWLFEAYHELGPLDDNDLDYLAGLRNSNSDTIRQAIEDKYHEVRESNPDPAHPLPGDFLADLLKILPSNLYKINERARISLQALLEDRRRELT